MYTSLYNLRIASYIELRCKMKQQIVYLHKYLCIYFILSLVCTSILSIFYIFNIVNISYLSKISYFISVLLLILICNIILKNNEKKAYLISVSFLGLYLMYTLISMLFINHSFLLNITKVIIVSFINLIYVLRK